MASALGAVTWWGFSQAIDLQNKDFVFKNLSDLSIKDSSVQELNVLLIGAGDCRHIMKTIAKAYKWPKRKINFYVIESSLELLAKHMLLLNVALESPQRMGLQEKSELFLELYGNSLIRAQSYDYVKSRATEYIKMVTDTDYLADRMPLFNIDALKFKEKDQLEAIFKFWRNPDMKIFDIEKYWDGRVRQHLGTRYDSREGVFDWDYSMKLVEKEAAIIRGAEYRRWRHLGLAFELREGDYTTPNKTLASGVLVKVDGEKVAQRGYWGDIVTSPYITFGIECEEEKLLKKTNGMYTKSALDISEFNVLSMMHEIATESSYTMPNEKDEEEFGKKKGQEGVTITEITDDEIAKEGVKESEESSNETTNDELMAVDEFRVYFLPIGAAPELYKKGKYQKLFQTVFVSNSMVHHLSGDLSTVFADQATVVLETAKFILELKAEQSQEFLKKITSMAQSIGCKPAKSCDAKDSFAIFNFNRNSSN